MIGGLSSFTSAFGFDDLSRPTSAIDPTGTYAWSYDADNNRLSQTVNGVTAAYTVDAANRLTSVGGVPVTTDANGNLLVDNTGQCYQWDARGRLTSVSRNGTSLASYTYATNGVRSSMTEGGVTTTFTLDGRLCVNEATGGANTPTLFGPTGPIERGSQWFTPDASGSVATVTGSTGSAIAQNCYGVFGQVMTTNPSSGNPLQYLGGMAEPSTGLDAIDSGFYEPDLGRLLSGNPAGAAGPSLGAGLSVFARTAPGAAGGVPSGSRDLLNRAGDFFGCWGDIITFGGTSRLRQIIGGAFFGVNGDLVDHSSDACAAGHAVGIAHGVATVLVGVLPPTTAVAGSATAGTAAASASSGPCFPAGTTITTRRGARSIEKVRAGDVVLSADPHTGRRSFQQVVRTFEHRVSLLMKIETADGRSVEATPTHPFWVEGKWFVAAKRLARGDLLEDEQSQGVAVAKVTARRGRFTVYNFEVAHTHTYFAAGFWVHNTCVPPPPSIEDVGFTVDQIENHILPRHGFQRAAEGAGEFSEDYSDWWTLGPLIDEALSMAPSNDTWTWNVDDQSYNFSVALGKPIGQTGGRVTSSTLGLAVQANGFGLTAYPE